MIPDTRYAKSGNVHIAYQVIGDGPVDLVFVPGWITHIELSWDEPLEAAFRRRLAGFSRLIVFDKRGTGLSDRVPVDQLPILEERMDDVRAVMDAVGSERAALMGVSEGGAMSALFAYATCCRRSTCRRSSSTAATRVSDTAPPRGDRTVRIRSPRAAKPNTWPSTSRGRGSSSSRAPTTCRGWASRTRYWVKSKSS